MNIKSVYCMYCKALAIFIFFTFFTVIFSVSFFIVLFFIAINIFDLVSLQFNPIHLFWV